MPSESKVLPVLGRITKAFSSDRPLESILKGVARDIAKTLAADTCAIMLINDQHRELLFKEGYGLSRWELENIRFHMGEGVAGWVAQNSKSARIGDVRKDGRFKAFPDQERKIVSLLCVPLARQGRVLGVVSVDGARKAAFNRSAQLLLEHLAGHTTLEIENHRLYELAVTDGLTQLFNRRYFLRRLEDELSQARRFHEPLAICLADLNGFKKINDQFGHGVGDEVLVGVSQMFRRELRAYDVAARYGGDEFAFLFLDTGRDMVRVIADRLRAGLDRDLPTSAGPLRAGACCGTAVYPEDGVDPTTLLAVADEALYRAKRG